jgi:hypothetical protein
MVVPELGLQLGFFRKEYHTLPRVAEKYVRKHGELKGKRDHLNTLLVQAE